MSLMDDLDFVACDVRADSLAYMRLRAFIEHHQPWLPPQQPGFGPWIEYKLGDKGPRIGDVVHILKQFERNKRAFFADAADTADCWTWDDEVVAYCVKLEAE